VCGRLGSRPVNSKNPTFDKVGFFISRVILATGLR
jgi:hypothetical protein